MKFNYKGNIDVKKYIDSLDVSLIPDEGQIDEIMKKSLTKSFLTLKTLSKEEKISKGDTVIFEIVSTIPKFNKPKLMVVAGNGLYDKTVEENMIGMCTGDKKEISINDTLVTFTILEVKRKDVPEISIDMVKAQNIENVETIEQYREHLKKQLMDNTIFPMVGQMVENIMKDIPFDEPEEEEIKILGELEADFFRESFKKDKNIDLDTAKPEEIKEVLGTESLGDFINARSEWYAMKAKQCIIYSKLLGIECVDEYDPMLHYDVLSKLTIKFVEFVKSELLRRKKENGSN